jgi:excisionase family DNA binding protein
MVKLPMKRFLRPDEVAEICLLTKRTIYRMIEDGRLVNVDMSKKPLRIPIESVHALFF